MILKKYFRIIVERFSIAHQQEDMNDIQSSIEKNIEFKGINIWTLIFAIFIASIGLNINSTAVIIGAMLISPLMGPIMGLGFSVGIFDFDLLKKSFKNLSVAVIISVITSATYFIISPLNEIQSELLARTTPTIYDVLIALFGGLAGVFAGSTKEKGNVLPGVAIATALMPPLCTAGYGIASLNFVFFIGAFYLFFINAVMISLSTFLMVRFLQFPFKQFVDNKKKYRVRKYVIIIVTLTVIPSIYLGYLIIEENIFKNKVTEFIEKEFDFQETLLISKEVDYKASDSNSIIAVLAGKVLENTQIDVLNRKLIKYGINNTKLIIKQGINSTSNKIDIKQLKSGIIEDIYKKNETVLQNKDEKIKLLEQELLLTKATQFPIESISNELNIIYPSINSISLSKANSYNVLNKILDTNIIVLIDSKKSLKKKDIEKINRILQLKFENNKIKILIE